jgi:hypothetical protein
MKTTKAVPLTKKLLGSIIAEEMAGFGKEEDVEKRAKETEEVDADELADSLEKKIDMISALKIEEHRIVKRLAQIKEQRRRMLKSISK